MIRHIDPALQSALDALVVPGVALGHRVISSPDEVRAGD